MGPKSVSHTFRQRKRKTQPYSKKAVKDEITSRKPSAESQEETTHSILKKFEFKKNGSHNFGVKKRFSRHYSRKGAATIASVKTQEQDVLRKFDLTLEYGPCMGITRLERWERAKKHGLNPPLEVKTIISKHTKEETYTQWFSSLRWHLVSKSPIKLIYFQKSHWPQSSTKPQEIDSRVVSGEVLLKKQKKEEGGGRGRRRSLY